MTETTLTSHGSDLTSNPVGPGKHANYFISAVAYDLSHKRITHLRRHIHSGQRVGTPEVRPRSVVVSDILNLGLTYCTIYESDTGEWRMGAEVNVIEIDDEHYLRTDKDRAQQDNLGELPEF